VGIKPLRPLETPELLNSSLPHAWDQIRKIRKSVGEALQGFDPALSEAAMMVTSELIENAVKYGEEVPSAREIQLSMSTDHGQLVIIVSNGCADLHGVKQLQQHVQEIADAPDKSALYMGRLEQLMSHPNESGKLGLYRIAFEGEFDLKLTYHDHIVAVTATRDLR
jgi:anti-sigma regulatory factor (Ser/Thr protein kinase)